MESLRFDAAAESFPVDRLNTILEAVERNDRIQALLDAQNVNPVVRMAFNDHGPKHVEVVLERAIELYGLLKAGGVSFNAAADHGLDEADEPVIIALAAILHDVGHVVHRDRHTDFSVQLAPWVLEDILVTEYDEATAAVITGEILHAILCHHTAETPLTLEAGVVRVADALDMEKGRSREPYERGGRGINTISSRAIRRVNLKPGDDVPVVIEIEMSSAAGIYQIDELLKSKVIDSRLEPFLDIVAVRVEAEEVLVDRFEL